MRYYRQFDDFDPLTFAPPDWPFPRSLSSIVRRARAMVEKRSRDELVKAANNADFFIEQYFSGEKDNYIWQLLQDGGGALRYLPVEACNESGIRQLLDDWPPGVPPPPDMATAENTNEVDALKAYIGDWQLDGESDFKDGHEYEYFAVLALWLVVDAMDVYTAGLGGGNEYIRLAMAGSIALAAMDAVCYAEQLRAEESQAGKMAQLGSQMRQVIQGTERLAEKKASRKISDNAKKAAMVKHKENHEMKVLVFDWCDSNFDLYPSMDATAEAVAGKIVPVTFRTARDWIRDWGRSARRP